MNAGRRREGGREAGKEGRKRGGELEWATVPVLGPSARILNTSIVCGPRLTRLAFWGIAGIKAASRARISALHVCAGGDGDAVSELVLFCLWVSSSCPLLRGRLPHVAPGATVKETRQDLEAKELWTSCSSAPPGLAPDAPA